MAPGAKMTILIRQGLWCQKWYGSLPIWQTLLYFSWSLWNWISQLQERSVTPAGPTRTPSWFKYLDKEVWQKCGLNTCLCTQWEVKMGILLKDTSLEAVWNNNTDSTPPGHIVHREIQRKMIPADSVYLRTLVLCIFYDSAKRDVLLPWSVRVV